MFGANYVKGDVISEPDGEQSISLYLITGLLLNSASVLYLDFFTEVLNLALHFPIISKLVPKGTE